MSETYTTIIQDIKDNDGDNICLKIIFKKITSEYLLQHSYITRAEAFDSKGRYFCAERLNKEFEYYVDKAKKCNFNDAIYIDFEGSLTIYLEGNGYNDCYGLDENKESSYHLQSIDTKIINAEKELEILKKKE